MLGKLLGNVVRIANVPAKAFEKLIDEENEPMLSLPLEKIAEALEEIDD